MKIMEMTKIDKIWVGLESETSQQHGLLYKRYSAEVLPDVFVAVKAAEKLRCIAIRVSARLTFDSSYWNKFKDIKIEILPDERDGGNFFLLIVLLNKQHKDSCRNY